MRRLEAISQIPNPKSQIPLRRFSDSPFRRFIFSLRAERFANRSYAKVGSKLPNPNSQPPKSQIPNPKSQIPNPPSPILRFSVSYSVDFDPSIFYRRASSAQSTAFYYKLVSPFLRFAVSPSLRFALSPCERSALPTEAMRRLEATSQIPNPKSQIPNPKSQIPNPKSPFAVSPFRRFPVSSYSPA